MREIARNVFSIFLRQNNPIFLHGRAHLWLIKSYFREILPILILIALIDILLG